MNDLTINKTYHICVAFSASKRFEDEIKKIISCMANLSYISGAGQTFWINLEEKDFLMLRLMFAEDIIKIYYE